MNRPEPDEKAALGLGVIVLIVIAFVVGKSFGGDAEAVTVTRTVTQPVTDIKTVTAPPMPVPYIPEACVEVIDIALQAREGARQLSASQGALSKIIDEAGKVIYTDDPNEVVRLSQAWMDLQGTQHSAWFLIGSADADMTRALKDCPH